MKNKELAHMFNRIADALEFHGENVFRVIAYRKAARVLDELSEDVVVLHKKNELESLPGIGRAIKEKIIEYLTTGKMKKYEEVTRELPGDLLDMLDIQNLGPKTLALAHKTLGVVSIEDLKKVINDGRLAKLPQMGEKKVENIKKGIELYERSRERLSIALAEKTANDVIKYLKQDKRVKAVSPAGSLRRWQETIGDIDILVTGSKGQDIIKYFTRYPGTDRVLAAGATKGSIIVANDVQVDVRIVPAASFGAALQYFTGSRAHNIHLRNIAKAKGMKLSEYGVFRGTRQVAGKTEQGVYKILSLPLIPPELREDRGEIDAARMNRLPRIVEPGDIKGDLQMHSTYSDGADEIEDLARAARKLRYHYILITDHSRSARYAHGLDLKRLKKQWREIETINKRLKRFRILKGIEVDILGDGSLDFPDRILNQCDIVLASIHQGFKNRVTERMCTAMDNPYVDIIAHPTGRLISQREGYVVDLWKVMAKAAETGTWLELNAFPDRLDLNDVNCKAAKDMGIKISIGTDAHSTEGLSWMKFGIATARRGWLEPQNIVNTYSVEKLLKLRKRRQ
ncbi:MAG: DNA polymerase/3'-5' exonuclease PolX [candidate division WOR-3 bacterium]|nr:MAG: DNA polymerase/3'-5' exonuclease PolX [candidate division WOR-3 bacterium]